MDQYLTSMSSVLTLVRILSMHALSGCDTTSYPYDKGSVTALNTMVSGIHHCLAVIDEIDITHTELMNAVMPTFVSL